MCTLRSAPVRVLEHTTCVKPRNWLPKRLRAPASGNATMCAPLGTMRRSADDSTTRTLDGTNDASAVQCTSISSRIVPSGSPAHSASRKYLAAGTTLIGGAARCPHSTESALGTSLRSIVACGMYSTTMRRLTCGMAASARTMVFCASMWALASYRNTAWHGFVYCCTRKLNPPPAK